MAINDTIAATDRWPRDRLLTLDDELIREGLPSLTSVRLRFSKLIHRVVGRGSIKSDLEYHPVRNAAELAEGHQEPLRKLLAAYKNRLAG